MSRWMILALALALAACGREAPQPPSSPPVAAMGVVSAHGKGFGGIWFELGASRRFLIAHGPEDAKVMALLDRSQDKDLSVTFRYEPDGFIDNASLQPRYRVRELSLEGTRISLPAGRPLAPPHGVRETARRDMAHAIALAEAGDYAAARTAIDRAIATKDLGVVLDDKALKARADILHAAAEVLPPEQQGEADRLRVQALADLEAALAQTPEDEALISERAAILTSLGAYEEAIAGYEKAAESNAFWATIRIAAIHRLQGRPDQALKDLDDYAADEDSDPTGMAFNYHRGWTLLELGRPADAAKALTEGLKAQPDYPWALARRACAYARLGRLTDALGDQETAAKLEAERYAVLPHNLPVDHDHARMQAVLAELRAAVGKNAAQTLEAPCVGYWPDEASRSRSPLLPARG